MTTDGPKVSGGDFTECWLWTAARDSKGYGLFYVGNRVQVRAHRWAYEFMIGPVPDGLQLDHLCRIPSCCNPFHLDPVTCQVNVRRGESPGARALRRTHCLRGHAYSEHGAINQGRRICRTCRIEYLRNYRQQEKQRRADHWAELLAFADECLEETA